MVNSFGDEDEVIGSLVSGTAYIRSSSVKGICNISAGAILLLSCHGFKRNPEVERWSGGRFLCSLMVLRFFLDLKMNHQMRSNLNGQLWS